MDGLVDCHLEGRTAWAAAKRERDGEARGTSDEDQEAERRHVAPQHRPVDQAEDGTRRQAEGRRQAPMLARHRLQRSQEHTGCEGAIEEDMDEQDAGEAIDGDAGQADGAEDGVGDTDTTEDAGEGEDGDDGRQGGGDAEERQQQATPREMPPRQGQGHQRAEDQGEERREQCLIKREAGDGEEICGIALPRLAAGREKQAREGSKDESSQGSEKGETGHSGAWRNGAEQGAAAFPTKLGKVALRSNDGRGVVR
jgi:hypothetical protein